LKKKIKYLSEVISNSNNCDGTSALQKSEQGGPHPALGAVVGMVYLCEK
jgi:hypothetical protein